MFLIGYWEIFVKYLSYNDLVWWSERHEWYFWISFSDKIFVKDIKIDSIQEWKEV